MAIGSALHLNGQMIPLIVERIARHSGRMPFLPRIVPNVPLIAARNAAFVSPNVRFAVDKLIDIELQGLRRVDVIAKKIYVIDKVVRLGVNAVVAIRKALRRERPDQEIIPERVRVRRLASDAELHGFAAERWGTYALLA